MRVPFIACWGKPNGLNLLQQRLLIRAGAVQMQMGTVMDIYPTVLSICGVKQPKGYVVDGFDLSTQLIGERDSIRSEEFLMHFPHQHRGSYFTTYRVGDWKLIYYYNPELPNHPAYELYNLKKDPIEIHNLATVETKRLIEMVHAMAAELEEQGACYPIDKDGNILKPFI